MIDAQAPVLLPGAGLVVPERVLPRRVGDRAQGVSQAEAEQGLEALAGGGSKQGIIDPGWRVIDVLSGRDDVEVTCEDQWLFRFKSFPRVLKKPRHPLEFIGIFIAVGRIAVGQIEAGDPQHAALGRNYAFEEARMRILVVARKP